MEIKFQIIVRQLPLMLPKVVDRFAYELNVIPRLNETVVLDRYKGLRFAVVQVCYDINPERGSEAIVDLEQIPS